LVDAFLDTWQFAATDFERIKQQNGLIELLRDGKATLSDLIDATERRRKELNEPKPPAFLLYVDQGEELYVRAEESQRRRFSELLAAALSDPRLRVMMSMRSDFLGFLQRDQPLFQVRELIEAPPLGEDGLREVVSQPAQLLGARFDNKNLVDIIARRAAEDSVKDVGALPLLSYTLDDMWGEMLKAGDGVLRLPMQSFEHGGVLVDRANRFLTEHPGAEDTLKRVLTLKLATVREDGEPTRRSAARNEFSDEEWRLVAELSGYPNRLLVTATSAAGETYAEVAHEAIFRRWDKLKEWIAAEREFLAWRGGLEWSRRAWEKTPDRDKDNALLMGFGLTQAQRWLAERSDDIPEIERTFLVQSRKAAQRKRWARALVVVLNAAIAAGVVVWLSRNWLKEEIYALANVGALTTVQERDLETCGSIKECSDCPEMIVVPAGSFMMGASDTNYERPEHRVTFAKPFAISKFELTFDEWDACAAHGDCDPHVGTAWGRGRRPATNVSWEDAQTYVKWVSRLTGKAYRLLSEAEYEYAGRAGTQTKYPWGDDAKLDGKAMANCVGCGSPWDGQKTAPVGSFAANKLGLYDMAGNVWEWTEDCYHNSYEGAPADGSAWISDDCQLRIVRGGSYSENPDHLRSAYRNWLSPLQRHSSIGIRVARTLAGGAGDKTAVPTAR
jgi:formylglycine-generating enzyme required for sulfatase activity